MTSILSGWAIVLSETSWRDLLQGKEVQTVSKNSSIYRSYDYMDDKKINPVITYENGIAQSSAFEQRVLWLTFTTGSTPSDKDGLFTFNDDAALTALYEKIRAIGVVNPERLSDHIRWVNFYNHQPTVKANPLQTVSRRSARYTMPKSHRMPQKTFNR